MCVRETARTKLRRFALGIIELSRDLTIVDDVQACLVHGRSEFSFLVAVVVPCRDNLLPALGLSNSLDQLQFENACQSAPCRGLLLAEMRKCATEAGLDKSMVSLVCGQAVVCLGAVVQRLDPVVFCVLASDSAKSVGRIKSAPVDSPKRPPHSISKNCPIQGLCTCSITTASAVCLFCEYWP